MQSRAERLPAGENFWSVEQVERIAGELARIAEGLWAVTRVPWPRSGRMSEEQQCFATRAKFLLRAMDEQTKAFPTLDRLGDPSWAMLLDLYVAWSEDRRISVTSLTIASRAPPTTALRHIAALIGKGMIERENDIADRRRTWLRLSGVGIEQMQEWFIRTSG